MQASAGASNSEAKKLPVWTFSQLPLASLLGRQDGSATSSVPTHHLPEGQASRQGQIQAYGIGLMALKPI